MKTVIGTPQARCREITQSGRLLTMAAIRCSPWAGTQRVAAMASLATSRNERPCCAVPLKSPMGLSMAMNHCGVLRKITGFFERHECGY